jgi:alpha/beta superfamily hydrolase
MADVVAFLCSVAGLRAVQSASPAIPWTSITPSLKMMLVACAMSQSTPLLYKTVFLLHGLLLVFTIMPMWKNPHHWSLIAYPLIPATAALVFRPAFTRRLFTPTAGYLAASFLLHEFLCVAICTLLYPAPFVESFIQVNLETERLHALSTPGLSQVWISSKRDDSIVLDALVYHPSKTTLRGRDSRNRWVVYLGGNGELYEATYESAVQLATKLSVNMLVFNHRGVGRSTGRVTGAADLVDDAVAAIRHLLEVERAMPEDIVVFGHSIGGGVASVLVADYFPQLGIVLDRSFSSLSDAAVSLSPFLRSWPDSIRKIVGYSFGDFDSVAAWKRISHQRKLILFHRNDQVIRYGESSIARLAPELVTTARQVIELEGRHSDPHNVACVLMNGHEEVISRMSELYGRPLGTS